MKRKKSSGRNPKDFCMLWKNLYVEKYKSPFHIKWMLDGNVFKRLMSTYSNVVLLKLIKFSFKDDGTTTKFLRSTGYNISVFEREINKYRQYLEGGCINREELDLEIPYWDDSRFSFIGKCVTKGDFGSLLQIEYNEDSNRNWELFLQKVKIQNRSFFYKSNFYYKRWKRLTSTKRTRIEKCHSKK